MCFRKIWRKRQRCWRRSNIMGVKMRKIMILLLTMTVLCITGCAILSPREEGYINTIPSGASAYLYEPATGKKVFVGSTPCNYYIKRGLFEAYVVLEKKGYNKKEIVIPSRGVGIDISANLERSYNDSFFEVYSSDLRSWVGKTTEELDQVFAAKGRSSLDVYGNGTIIHEPINYGSLYGLPNVSVRLIFYVKNNKIYNIVKE